MIALRAWMLARFVAIGAVAASPVWQVFVDADGDAGTGYGVRGSELLIDVEGDLRLTEPMAPECPAGWGAVAEFYEAGEWIGGCSVPVFVYTFDGDGDGDIDLRDFAAFQLRFTGPG